MYYHQVRGPLNKEESDDGADDAPIHVIMIIKKGIAYLLINRRGCTTAVV